MRDRREIAAVFAGGAIGAVLRAWLGRVLVTDAGAWPWATFVVNIVAAFVLGWFSTVLLERLPVSRFRRPFVGTGICGGLSTFSTMQVETVRLVQDGYLVLALAYVLASLVAGLIALHLATALARRTVVRP
jgi:CrcB protein